MNWRLAWVQCRSYSEIHSSGQMISGSNQGPDRKLRSDLSLAPPSGIPIRWEMNIIRWDLILHETDGHKLRNDAIDQSQRPGEGSFKTGTGDRRSASGV